MADPAQTETVLHEILAELRRQRIGDDLWKADDIADYLKLSLATVRNRVVTNPTFPAAVTIPTTEEGGSRRWVAKEVKAWATKWRQVN